MATGWQTFTDPSKRYRVFRLLDGVVADAGAPVPTTSSSGVEMPKDLQVLQLESVFLAIYDRSGTGVLNLTYAKVWGYIKDLDKWFPLGTGTDAGRGKANEGQTVGEVASDEVRLIQIFDFVTVFDRLAVELNTVAGTNPVFDVDLILPRFVGRSKD